MLILIDAPTTSLEALSRRYVTMLEAAGIPDPLTTQITVGAILADLFALAEQPIPPDVAASLQYPGGAL